MKTKVWYKKWWIWVILGVISTIFFAIVGACSDETVQDINNTSVVATESSFATEKVTELVTESILKETEVISTEEYTEKSQEETTEIEEYYEEANTEAYINSEEYVEAETEKEYVPVIEEEPKDEGRDYVINNNSGKFHYPSCSSVNRIKSHNREDYYGTRDELLAMGYESCGNCHP